MVYDRRSSFNGIDSFRYSPRDNFVNTPDKCFCVNATLNALVEDDGCLFRGAIDLTQCLGEFREQFLVQSELDTQFLIRRSNYRHNASLLRC